MPRRFIGLWRLIFAIAVFGGMASAKQATNCTSSEGNFSTICPSGWNRLDWDDGTISVISFPVSQREEGVVIKDGGAQIIVSKNALNGASLAQWIEKDAMGTRTLNRTPVRKFVRNAACSNTSYLEVEVDQGSQPSEIESQIYCAIGEDVFKFELRFWANDSKAETYRSALAKMFSNFSLH